MINLAYFKRFFKESLLIFTVITIVFAFFNLVAAVEYEVIPTYNFSPFINFIYPPFFFIFFSPLYILDYKSSRRKIDVYYSLPLSKQSILNTRILVTILMGFLSYFISYFITIGVMASKENIFDMFNFGYAFAFFFVTFGLSVPLILFNTYFANKGNSTIDRILFMIFYIYGFVFIVQAICLPIIRLSILEADNSNIWYDAQHEIIFWFTPLTPISKFSDIFNNLILINISEETIITIKEMLPELIGSTVLLFVLAAIAFVLLQYDEKNEKSERITQSSTTYFGYKIIIPLMPLVLTGFTYQMPNSADIFTCLLIGAFILSSFWTLYFMYKKKLVIKKDAIVLGVITLTITIIEFSLLCA